MESGMDWGGHIYFIYFSLEGNSAPTPNPQAGSGEWRAMKGKQVCTLPQRPKAPLSRPAPKLGMGLEGSRLIYSSYKWPEFGSELACSEAGI